MLTVVQVMAHKMHGAAWANIAIESIGTHKQSSGIKSVSRESRMVRQYTDAYQSRGGSRNYRMVGLYD